MLSDLSLYLFSKDPLLAFIVKSSDLSIHTMLVPLEKFQKLPIET